MELNLHRYYFQVIFTFQPLTSNCISTERHETIVTSGAKLRALVSARNNLTITVVRRRLLSCVVLAI